MKRQNRLMICLLAAAAMGVGLIGLSAQRLQAQAPAKADKTSVAVVNVAELIAKCEKNVAFQGEIQKRQGKLRQEAEEKQNKINLMKADLDVLADAAARSAKERQIIEALSEFQAWQQIQQQYLLRDQRSFLVELYGDIDQTVAAVAEREGYDLVLFDTPTQNFDQLNPEQLVNAIGNRRVVYRNEKVNLTANVLAQLNTNHRNRGGE